MPLDITPKKLQEQVHRGIKRHENFRNARTMFLRNYVGQYYDQTNGDIGAEPLNLIFNAIRVLIPNIVMNFPTHKVSSNFLYAKDYAELLGMALEQQDKQIGIKDVYRRVIVDAIFTLGILKTGIASSDSVYAIDESDQVDTGEVYTECVDFDNFIADPMSREHLFRDASWLGDRMTVPRSTLLESGLYDNALIEQLPAAGGDLKQKKAASAMSMRSINPQDDLDLFDEVEIAELWVPSAGALVTVPASEHVVFDEYLRVDEYYGPVSGPYTFLALTPPVPGNPMPIPMVGIWNDLHVLANRMAKKIVDQAQRQKDVIGYKSQAADDAQSLKDASDGEAVAVDDPDAVKVHSFGGQQNSNEVHMSQLQGWFNQMAANPEGMAGNRFDADSATEASILAERASVGLEDMKDLVYQMAADEGSKRAWYLHTDPFMRLPLIRRVELPAQYAQSPQGPQMTQPAQLADQQIILTPEARRGDYLDYTFMIEPGSMGRRDSGSRLAEAMDFAVKIMPAIMATAQNAMMLGIPLDAKAMLIRMAKDRGITWMHEVLFDPEFQMKMNQLALMGPALAESKGMPNAGLGSGGGQLGAILQNGQPGQVQKGAPSQQKQQRQTAQQGANESQSQMR